LLVKKDSEGAKFMMGKGQGKEKKPHKKDIDLEYPTWPLVDYKFLDVNSFEEVRKFSTKGMDLKSQITDAQVTTIDVVHVFDNVNKFRITNTLLSEE